MFFCSSKDPFGRTGGLFLWTGLQGTKLRRGATLQCNVDLRRLTYPGRPAQIDQPPTTSEQNPTREQIHGSSFGWQARPDYRRIQGHRRGAHQIDASAHVVDLRKPEDLARLAKDAAEIDILVNNAGDIPGGSIDKIDEPTWRHAWELKVFGYINLTRAIYAQLKTRAKNQFGDENRYKEFQQGLPLGRPAHAREIGDLMAFLASERAGYTSGVIYTVDGGISAGWG